MSHHLRTLAAAAALALCPLAARAEIDVTCAPDAVVDWAHPVITLQRERCFGSCPAYTVEIHADGTVLFDGRYGVQLGDFTAHIPPGAVRALAARFRAAGYLRMADAYRRPPHIFDGPSSVVTSISFAGCGKQVSDNHLSQTAPPSLRRLEDEIDRVAHTARWATAP